MEIFAKRLVELQTESKIMKKDIASAVGISSKQYKRYEVGEQEPTLSTLVALAKFFNVSLDWLTGISDTK